MSDDGVDEGETGEDQRRADPASVSLEGHDNMMEPGAEEDLRWESLGGSDPTPHPGSSGESPPPGSGPERRPTGRGRSLLALMLAVLVLLSGAIGWGLARSGQGDGGVAVEPPLTAAAPASPTPGQLDGDFDAQAIADRVEPAVVNVNTVFDANPFDTLPASGSASGTGMVVTSGGQVLTNNHVIEGATKIEVTIPGRSETYPAEVVGANPSGDIAVLRVLGVSGLPTVTLADSSSLAVGQEVVALGNALGGGGSPAVTEGAIIDLERSVTVGDGRGDSQRLSGLIQTDAPIQPGDSGGPLVNSAGQVVGMITAGGRAQGPERASSIGFAIPSSDALDIVNEIRAGHESSSIIIGQPGYLGVGVRDLDTATAARLGLEASSGVLMLGVATGTPADRAGISEGSVITAIDGRQVAWTDLLGSAIRSHDPGDRIEVSWVDPDRRLHTATVRLVTGPAV